MEHKKKNKESLKIALIVNHLSAGGAEKQALLLTKLLSEDHDTLLILFNNKIESKYASFIQEHNLNVRSLKGNVFKRIFSLYSILVKNNVEFVFTYLLVSNLLGAIVGKFAGVKYRIGGVRNALLNPKKAIIQKFLNNYLNTKTVFNNYSGIKHYAQKGFNKKKMMVIPNCITVPILNKSNKVEEKVNIITVGRFVEQKDYFSAIKVIADLVNLGYTNIQYTIIGFGLLEREIREAIIEYDVSQYVSIVINPSNIDKYFNESNIYFSASLFEGLSNSLLEAMSHGLPIIATNVGDNEYLVENENNGYLVPARDTIGMTSAFIKFIKDPEKITSFGLNSYKKVKANYSEEPFKEKYLNLMHDLK